MCFVRVFPMVMSAHIFSSFTSQRGADPSSACTERLCWESSRGTGGTLYPEDGSRSIKCVDWQHSNSLWGWHNYSANLETKDATDWIVQLCPSLQFPRPSAAEFWLKAVNTGMHYIHTGHLSMQLSRKMSTGLRKVIEGDKPCCGLIVIQISNFQDSGKSTRIHFFSHMNVTASNFEIKTHSGNSKSWKREEGAWGEILQQKNTIFVLAPGGCISLSLHWRARLPKFFLQLDRLKPNKEEPEKLKVWHNFV